MSDRVSETFFVIKFTLIPKLFSDLKYLIWIERYTSFYRRVNALTFHRNALLEVLFLNFDYYKAHYIFSESLKNSLSNDTHIDKIKQLLYDETARQKSKTPALWRRKRGLMDLSVENLSAPGDFRRIKLLS